MRNILGINIVMFVLRKRLSLLLLLSASMFGLNVHAQVTDFSPDELYVETSRPVMGGRNENFDQTAQQIQAALRVQMIKINSPGENSYRYRGPEGLTLILYKNFDSVEKKLRLQSSDNFYDLLYMEGGTPSNQYEVLLRLEKSQVLAKDHRLLLPPKPVHQISSSSKAPRIKNSKNRSPSKQTSATTEVADSRPKELINVVDVEATCWDAAENKGMSEIIEVGITVVDPNARTLISTDSILIKPSLSTVSPFCTKLTSLTPEMIESEGITFEEATQLLSSKYDAKNRLLASYGNYDKRIFKTEFERRGIANIFGNKHLNIKALVQQTFHLKHRTGMVGALGILGIKLVGTHHRGADDSLNIAKILLALISRDDVNI